MRQTLIDTLPFSITPQQLNESIKNKKGNYLVEGRLQTAETKNGNGRYYPREVLEREVKKYMEGPVKEKRALGELDHPDSAIINLKNVSHNIVECYWDGDDVMGKIEILPTPSGNILKELFKNGISLQEIGEALEVQDDFELLCWDFVSTPSTPGAYVAPLQEGLKQSTKPYPEINKILTDILCNNGNCPII